MGGLSITHWLVLAVVGIVFFGPKRLPQLGSSLGESIRGFKKAMSEDDDNQEKPPQNQAQRRPELPLEDPIKHARVVEEKDPSQRS